MWDRPLTSRGQRLRAWTNMLFSDHGIFRLFYINEHAVTREMRRSAQPAPGDIARAAEAGVRTIVNLRGGREHGAWPLQVEAAAHHGVALREFMLRSRGLPDREQLLELPAFLDSLSYPILAHCKSGADRAGMFSALFLLVRHNARASEAKRQLAFRYGHVKLAKTGVLDAFLDAYEREGEARGIAFMDWVRDHYDPAAIEANFHESFWASLVIDKLLKRE
jgi:protein tyrosine phosphatase (PTP) superfamily phosphohydrolase (DUF442 family)